MLSRRLRRFIRVGAVVFCGLVLWGVFRVAGGIIERSGEWVIEGETNCTEEGTSETEVETESDILLGYSGIRLYENTGNYGLDTLSGTEDPERVFNQITIAIDNGVFDSLESYTDLKEDLKGSEDVEYFRSIDRSSLDLDSGFCKNSERFYIENSITVIGLYGGRYVIGAYNYSGEGDDSGPAGVCERGIVVVDYENVNIYFGVEDSIELGNVISLAGIGNSWKIMELVGINVLFVRG